MVARRLAALLALVLACSGALAVPGIALAQMGGGGMSMQGGMMGPMHKPASAADTEMMRGMMQMRHAMMTAPKTGDADQDFVSMMIPHHQGAVSMAETELKYGKDPEMRALAKDIVAAQDREIKQMQAWQTAHPVPAATPPAAH